MKRYESKYNPAAKELSEYLYDKANKDDIRPDVLAKITRVLDGVERMDEMISQKEQLLVQKEKELVRLKSITDNSSKVARDVISESKGNLDQAVSLHKSGQFSEALKYSDIALYNIGDIDNLGLKTIAQANNLYLERKQQHVDSASKRDYLYNSSVVNGVNAFGWVKSNPTRDFYTFFREALNIPDKEQKSPDNVRIIKKLYELLPLYVEEAQRTNYFYNEYNKYYDAMTKLQQVINIYNIKAASSKGLKDYEDALKSCDIALEIDPKNLTLSNLKNAILQEKQAVEVKKVEEEKLLVSQTKEIEKLKETLALKEVETQEKNKLLTQKGNELASTEKVLIDKHQKETEALKALLAQKELEHQELLTRKDKEIIELEKVKNELLKKELLEILPQARPDSGYNKPFAEWHPTWWGKKVIDAGNFEEIKRYLPELREKAAKFKEENLEKQAKELENTKRLQEENIKKEQLLSNQNKLLSDKEQGIEELKALIEQSKIEKEELLAKQELAVANKSHMKNQIINELREEVNLKENEVVDLRIQNLEKELITQQKEKLLIQKESELADKNDRSFVKNQVINELQENIHLKEKEAYKLQIELLTKQLEAAQEIGKQKEINTALIDENEVLGLKMQYYDKEVKNRETEKEILLTQKQKLSFLVSKKEQEFQNLLIQKEIEQKELLIAKELAVADKSFVKNQVIEQLREEIEGLNKQLLDNQPIYRSIYLEERSCQPGDSLVERQMASLDLSSINLSPIDHGGQNQIVGNILGNFDIENQHITHSIALGGETSESFSIIDAENSH